MKTVNSFILKLFLFLLSFCFFVSVNAQSRWSFELQFGGVQSLDLPLTFHQEGYPDIRIQKADFYSESFATPPYWDWRFAKWFKKRSIELEAVHHKFYLRNKPAEVERFGISHGYNIFFLNYGMQFGKYFVRAGAGAAVLHAESTVRGMEYPEGPGFDL
jgi:hypothetical protein